MSSPPDTAHAAVAQRLDRIEEPLALAAGRLIARVWPRPDRSAEDRAEQLLAKGRDHRGTDAQTPCSMLVVDRDADHSAEPQVIGHALTFPRTIGFELAGDSREMTVLALAMVATDPDRRGEGLGALVVRAAFDLVDSGVYPFALFQTSDPVQPFYERLGATLVTNPIVNSKWTPSSRAASKHASPFWDDVVMRYPAELGAGGEAWPKGAIDLRGEGY